MSKKIPIEMFDSTLQARAAETKRRSEFAGLFERYAVGVKSGVLDMNLFRRFFADRRDELAAGIVSKYNFPIWETIGKVLSFDMEYVYSYVDVTGDIGQAGADDICCESDFLAEERAQREINEALKSYLVAAGALARRIGSSTCDGFRQLLVEREFSRVTGTRYFDSEDAFGGFLVRLTELLHLLWADNEISRQISIAQMPPHPSKKGLKNEK